MKRRCLGCRLRALENELGNLDKDEDFNPNARRPKRLHPRKSLRWRDGDAKRLLLVALYRGHPQPETTLPDCDYKNLIVAGAKHWQLPADYIQELEAIQTA